MIIHETQLHMPEKVENHKSMPFILQKILKTEPKEVRTG